MAFRKKGESKLLIKNATVKPPFKWTGGKNRMREQYKDIFFPKNGELKTFVDMFCGSCSVSLWVAENFPNCKIVLNDKNAELIELYRVFQKDYDNLEERYTKNVFKFLSFGGSKEDVHTSKKKYYYDIRERYCHHWTEQTTAENAGDLLFMMRINFNGIWKGYNICNGRYSTPPGTLTQKEKFFKVDEIRKFRDFLKKCTLRCTDFGNLTSWMKSGTYYYADPPYRDSTVVYDGDFSEKDQKKLVSFLKECSDTGCWVSESNKEIGDGFWEKNFGENYNIHDMSAKYTAGRGKTLINAKEVLVTNLQ